MRLGSKRLLVLTTWFFWSRTTFPNKNASEGFWELVYSQRSFFDRPCPAFILHNAFPMPPSLGLGTGVNLHKSVNQPRVCVRVLTRAAGFSANDLNGNIRFQLEKALDCSVVQRSTVSSCASWQYCRLYQWSCWFAGVRWISFVAASLPSWIQTVTNWEVKLGVNRLWQEHFILHWHNRGIGEGHWHRAHSEDVNIVGINQVKSIGLDSLTGSINWHQVS